MNEIFQLLTEHQIALVSIFFSVLYILCLFFLFCIFAFLNGMDHEQKRSKVYKLFYQAGEKFDAYTKILSMKHQVNKVVKEIEKDKSDNSSN